MPVSLMMVEQSKVGKQRSFFLVSIIEADRNQLGSRHGKSIDHLLAVHTIENDETVVKRTTRAYHSSKIIQPFYSKFKLVCTSLLSPLTHHVQRLCSVTHRHRLRPDTSW